MSAPPRTPTASGPWRETLTASLSIKRALSAVAEVPPLQFAATLLLAQLFVALLNRVRIEQSTLHPELSKVWGLAREDSEVILASFVAMLVILLIARSPAWLARGARLLCVLFAQIHCLSLAINVISIRTIGTPLTYQWLEFADAFNSTIPFHMLSGVITPVTVAFLVFSFLAPVIFLVLFAFVRDSRLGWSGKGALVVSSAACLAIAMTPGVSQPASAKTYSNVDEMFQANTDLTSNQLMVLLRSYLFDATSKLRQLPYDPSLASNIAARPAGPVPTQVATRPDIILIVMESVSSDAVSENIESLPNIRRLQREGTVFRNATVTTPTSNRTMFGLFFSRYPLLQTAAETTSLGKTDETLVGLGDVMRGAGYQLAIISGQDFRYQNDDEFLASHGIRPIFDITKLSCDGKPANYQGDPNSDQPLDDECIFRNVLAWMSRSRSPIFLTIWTGGTHFPYEPKDKSIVSMEERFKAALHDLDEQIGRIDDEVARRGRPTLVIVMGDHGESFGKHGFQLHANSVYDEEIHVPVIVKGPGFAKGAVSMRAVNPTSIAPTIVAAASIQRPSGWQGKSLLESPDSDGADAGAVSFALNSRPMAGYRTAEEKYVLFLESDRMVRFDLATDPDEMNPRPVSPDKALEVRKRIAAWDRYNRSLYGLR